MKPLSENILSSAELKLMFSNVEIIRNLSNTLLDSLLERTKAWSEQLTIGDVFKQMVQN
jgi:hypothetical protein